MLAPASASDRILRRAVAESSIAEYLAFRLSGETYALPLSDIREILTQHVLTPVPRAPKEILGIVSVRGQLVTVLDPRVRLRLKPQPQTKRSRILAVLAPSGETMGLFVDEVLQVYRLAPNEIEHTSQALGGNAVEHVVGIGRRDGVLLFLLSLPPLVAMG